MESVTWTSTHQGQPAYSQCTVANLPAAETNTEAPFSGVISQLATWWLDDYNGPLPA